MGFGGYVSLCGWGWPRSCTRIPLVLHEQNSVPGLANKTMSCWAERIGVTYPESIDYLRGRDRVTVTGNPVRPEVLGAYARVRPGRSGPCGRRARAARLRRQQGSAPPELRLPSTSTRSLGPCRRCTSCTSRAGREARRRARASCRGRGRRAARLHCARLPRRHGSGPRRGRPRRRASGRDLDRRDHGDRAAGGARAVSVRDGRPSDAQRARRRRGRRGGAGRDADLDTGRYEDAVLGLLAGRGAQGGDGRGVEGARQARRRRSRGQARRGSGPRPEDARPVAEPGRAGTLEATTRRSPCDGCTQRTSHRYRRRGHERRRSCLPRPGRRRHGLATSSALATRSSSKRRASA